MKTDPEKSVFQERDDAEETLSRQELQHCRLLLRRLRFLESKVEETGGLASGNASGGAAFAEWEINALAWVLTDVEFLVEVKP